MSVEISFPVIARVNVYFNVEPGTVITEAMIQEKIDHCQAYMDNVGNIDASDDVSFYVAIDDRMPGAPIETYDREKGVDREIEVGATA